MKKRRLDNSPKMVLRQTKLDFFRQAKPLDVRREAGNRRMTKEDADDRNTTNSENEGTLLIWCSLIVTSEFFQKRTPRSHLILIGCGFFQNPVQGKNRNIRPQLHRRKREERRPYRHLKNLPSGKVWFSKLEYLLRN